MHFGHLFTQKKANTSIKYWTYQFRHIYKLQSTDQGIPQPSTMLRMRWREGARFRSQNTSQRSELLRNLSRAVKGKKKRRVNVWNYKAYNTRMIMPNANCIFQLENNPLKPNTTTIYAQYTNTFARSGYLFKLYSTKFIHLQFDAEKTHIK